MWHLHIAKVDEKTFLWSFPFFILRCRCLRSAEQWIMTCLNVSQFFIIHHINIKPAGNFSKPTRKSKFIWPWHFHQSENPIILGLQILLKKEERKKFLKNTRMKFFEVFAPFSCHVVTWFNWWRLLFAAIQKCSTTIKHFSPGKIINPSPSRQEVIWRKLKIREPHLRLA